jgi:hypothetical protein
MNKTYYYLATIAIYIFEIILATVVKDLGIVFQFAAAISGSSIQFIWPGYFFLHAERKFGTQSDWDSRKGIRVMAWAYVIAGLILLVSLLGGTIFNIIKNF